MINKVENITSPSGWKHPALQSGGIIFDDFFLAQKA